MSTAPLFFADADKLRAAEIDTVFLLDGDEGHHAAAVRRLRVGEWIDLSDGAGLVCPAEVVAVAAHAIEARILSCTQLPPPTPRLTVVQALAKGDRNERAVETLTEVGVDAILPWQAARSIVRWEGARGAGGSAAGARAGRGSAADARAGRGAARWRATAREAAKQARRPWVPDVGEVVDTAGVVARLAAPSALGIVLHEAADLPLSRLVVPPDRDLVLVVGPEGGITDDELAAFEAASATAFGLGPTVLRTSTAGTVGAAVVLARSGRLDARKR